VKRVCKTYPSGIITTTFPEVCMELEFVAEEFSRDVDVFTTDYDDMLSIEDLFGDCGGKTTCTHKISLSSRGREGGC
jgi:hypothetical protein